MEDAITRILGPNPEDRFWYLTLYNENYPMPALPEGARGRGRYAGASSTASTASPAGPGHRDATCGPRCCFSGPMWSVAMEAQELLADALGGVGRHLGRDLVERPAHRRAGGRALEPPAPRSDAPPPLVTEALGAGPDPGGRHHRLHARRAGPGGPFHRPALHLLGHRRLRALRCPGRPAAALRGRRGPSGAGGAERAGPDRSTAALGRRSRHHRPRHRRLAASPASSSDPPPARSGLSGRPRRRGRRSSSSRGPEGCRR